MTRRTFIEMLRRQVYGGFPVDEADITDNLINLWINQGIAVAAKNNYKENIQLEGIGFVNNSFYSTFKGLTVTKDEQFLYKFTLPQIPLSIGNTEGISRILFKDSNSNISYPAVLLSENQVGYYRSMRVIPNKVLAYPEGEFCFVITTIIMTDYTATVTLISGGDSTNLNSTLNLPDDSLPIVVSYIQQQLLLERNQPVDASNDGQPAVKTT